MKQEVIHHRKLHLIVLIVIFFVVYVLITYIVGVLNTNYGLGISLVVSQIFFLYITLMFLLRHQFHRFSYSFESGHLTIKDLLLRREKTLIIIPQERILSVEEELQRKRKFYNRIIKAGMKHVHGTRRYYIEYDDLMDISLLEISCSESFAKEVCNHL